MDIFTKILLLAYIVETIVETFKPFWDKSKRDKDRLISLVVGLCFGVLINLFAGIDLFEAIGIPLTSNFPQIGVWVSFVLTAIIFARSSNLVHDFINFIKNFGTVLKSKTV